MRQLNAYLSNRNIFYIVDVTVLQQCCIVKQTVGIIPSYAHHSYRPQKGSKIFYWRNAQKENKVKRIKLVAETTLHISTIHQVLITGNLWNEM
jgi:hypothetical protein